ncbi:helix-turn-helix domain-containing protein [Marilutibacter chinensis]|uniref:AraC family transcriptional regulator n=1 Tax=Marilutibacter chinensis TaxID=2912247 RepID=A0ABS9HU47_9GAMM|nr:AraC family transcriptional regulator [Lysobacter chinensis]MCF7222238.1 AraC family transcriptional regulator [Lysobacter chinensis]
MSPAPASHWIVVYAIGAAQAALLALALWRRPANAAANRLLAAWLGVVGFDLAVKAAFLAAPAPWLFRVLLPVGALPFVYGVFFYLYVRTLTTARRLAWRDVLHLAGFAVALGLLGPALLADAALNEAMMRQWLSHALPPPVPWYSVFLYAWSLSYVAAALLRVVRYRREVRERRSDADRMSLRWVVAMALGQVVIWAIALLHDTTRIRGIDYLSIYGAVAAWACVLGYLGLMQAPVSPERQRDAEEACAGTGAGDVAAPDDPAGSAAASIVDSVGSTGSADDPRLPDVQARLERLMEEEALYLAPALTIAQVARRSGYPEYLVSLAINRGFGCTFWDYVNRQRIGAARRCFADPDDGRTILDIAYACGFTSKSTFNAAFKRETGATPSAWRARHARTTTVP